MQITLTHLFWVIIFVLCINALSAQSPFLKTFHLEDEYTRSEVANLQQMSDGGFLVNGRYDDGPFQLRLYIIKLDGDGNVQWTLIRDPFETGSVILLETAHDVVEWQGKYVVLSEIQLLGDTRTSPVLLHLDPATGSILDLYTILALENHGDYYRMIKTRDEDLVILGYDGFGDPATPDTSFFTFVKTHPRNETRWVQQYADAYISSAPAEDQGEIVEDEAGNFYIAGGGRNTPEDMHPPNGGRKVTIAKTDPEGNLLWMYQNKDADQADAIEITTAGIWVSLVEFGDKENVLFKLDFEGNLLWAKGYDTYFKRGIRCVSNQQGEVFLVGIAEEDYSYQKIIKVDEEGEVIWSKSHQVLEQDVDLLGLRDAVITGDGGVATLGYVFLPNTGIFHEGVYILRLNRDGEFGDIVSRTEVALPRFEVSVFPNPTSDVLHIEREVPASEAWSVRLLDTSGKLHHEGQLSGATHTLNMQVLPAGSYFLELRNGRGQVYQKVVVKQ